MAANETANAIQRTIDARYKDFADALQKSITVFGIGGDQGQRKKEFLQLATATDNLHEILADVDRPLWLREMMGATTNFRHNPDGAGGQQLLKVLLQVNGTIAPIKLLPGDHVDLDFDAIFDQLKRRHGLADLFDRLAQALTDIINSGEVESTTALAALQKMVAALRANRDGSQSSMESSFNYARFGWGLAIEYLKKVPGIEPAINAAEKEFAKGQEEIEAVKQEMRDAAMERLVAALPNLEKLAAFAAQLPALPPPKPSEFIEGEYEVRREPPSLPPAA
jgi:hypothetical protein